MALDLEEEKDCLKPYDEVWADETLALKKWSDKKERLEKLNSDINTPKIKPNNNVNALFRVFEKFLKDANMNVNDEAVKSIGYLAKGLKKSFYDQAKMLIDPILTNMKKRPMMIKNASETLENIL
jgi:hypothetical protein